MSIIGLALLYFQACIAQYSPLWKGCRRQPHVATNIFFACVSKNACFRKGCPFGGYYSLPQLHGKHPNSKIFPRGVQWSHRNIYFLSNQSTKIVKYEMFNPTVMLSLLKHEGIGLEDKKRLKQYNKNRQNGNVVEVKYDYPKSYKDKVASTAGRLVSRVWRALGSWLTPHCVGGVGPADATEPLRSCSQSSTALRCSAQVLQPNSFAALCSAIPMNKGSRLAVRWLLRIACHPSEP